MLNYPTILDYAPKIDYYDPIEEEGFKKDANKSNPMW